MSGNLIFWTALALGIALLASVAAFTTLKFSMGSIIEAAGTAVAALFWPAVITGFIALGALSGGAESSSEYERETDCHPSYEGECLDPASFDYDCDGGSGDGPDYAGTVSVVGDDEFGLDRDGDGVACE